MWIQGPGTSDLDALPSTVQLMTGVPRSTCLLGCDLGVGMHIGYSLSAAPGEGGASARMFVDGPPNTGMLLNTFVDFQKKDF